MSNTALELKERKEVLVYGGVKLRKGNLVGSNGIALVDSEGNELYGYGLVPNEEK